MFEIASVWASAGRLPGAGSRASADAPTTLAALCAEAPRLRRLVHRLLGMRAAANDLDDIVQDVLLAAMRSRKGFRGDARLSTWLTRIALRKAQNHQRAARLRDRVFALFGHQIDQVVPQTGEGGDNPRLAQLQAALRDLPHRDREVLVLRYLEQRDVIEVADLLGCSRAAADARLSRARQRLRNQFQSSQSGGISP